MRTRNSGAKVARLALPAVIAGILIGGCAQLGERGSELGATTLHHRSAGTKDNPSARDEWFYGQRAYPLKAIPPGARQKALAQASKIAEVGRTDKASQGSLWTQVGPLGFDTTQTAWGRQSGRVRAMAIDPSNSNRLFLGVATGGVWRSEDSGANWTPLTDSQPSLAVGAIAIAPGNSQVVYVGTGEGNGQYYGAGLLKSVDGGDTWSVLSVDQFNRSAFSGLAVDPGNPDVVIACTTAGRLGDRANFINAQNAGTGIFRSTDGGQSFTQIRANSCFDLAVVANDFNTMYYSSSDDADGSGVYKSTDAGASWALMSGAINGPDVASIDIALSKDGSRIYLGGVKGSDIAIQVSTDAGASWQPPRLTPNPPSTSNELGQAGTYCEAQCGYDNDIGVNPFNPDDVIFSGIGSYRSTDGAQTFTRIADNNNAGTPPLNVHVDHHVVLHDPAIEGVVYSGNDGGVWRSADGGSTWTSLNGTLGTLQPYHLSLHPTDPNIMFTGNQDNGTLRRTDSNTWTEVNGGDGSFTAINPANPQIVYASVPKLVIARSTDGGATFQDLPGVPTGEPVQFVAPFVIDPANPQTLYGGTNRLHRTTDGGDTWAPITDVLTPGADASITAIALAPMDSSIIYVGGSDGSVARINSAGTMAINAAPLPGRFVTSIAVSPTDSGTVYVSYSGFNGATPDTPGHVFKSSDGGASWSNISDNLPDAPANSIAIRPDMADEVYVGTDVGVFISTSGGGSWARMSNGLPNAPVMWLAVNGSTNTLAAATYGRSVWKTELGGTTMPPGGTVNYSYTYFNASEAGWGYNVSHQGNLAYGTWYTYAPDGQVMFLTVQATETSPGNFAGPIYRVMGTPFDMINGTAAVTGVTEIGNGTL
ncbi:MAG: hypothetical protein KDI71_06265, partial [Xanthomonadales bacterium]|nr:hypothetical protein [Xanthomonadales bacterium]